MRLNLSALSDKELIRYVEGRDLTELEAELVERLRSWDAWDDALSGTDGIPWGARGERRGL